MKVRAEQFTSQERSSLFQKLRLARASLRHGTRVNLSFTAGDAATVGGLDPEVLRRWAGPQLGELAAEVERAGKSSAGLADVTIAKSASGPQEAAALRLRAEIFGELVRFAVAERRLAEPRGIALVADPPHGA
jgi:hypothetical protein